MNQVFATYDHHRRSPPPLFPLANSLPPPLANAHFSEDALPRPFPPSTPIMQERYKKRRPPTITTSFTRWPSSSRYQGEKNLRRKRREREIYIFRNAT
jgi:hypothetical protein